MADAGEGVVFCVEDDEAPAGAVLGGEGGLDAVGAGRDVEVEVA